MMADTSSGVADRNSETSVKKLHQFSPKEVAEELTLMDAELLRKIASEELENGAWMKRDKKHLLSPNIMAMVGTFNQLALLVPTEILDETTPQSRAKIITAYIQVASKCHSHHNYNSLKAILAGLQCTPIFRLNKTWKEVSSRRKKRFNQLSKLMSEEENWSVYRKELEPKIDSNYPFIPFLGVFLTDVALSQEASSMSKRARSKMSVVTQSEHERNRNTASRRSSTALYETYTILEPITMRNRLEKLRSMTSQDHFSGDDVPTSVSTHSDSDKEDDSDSFYSCRSSVTSPNDSVITSPSPSKTSIVSSSSASSASLRFPSKVLSELPLSPSPTSSDSIVQWDVGDWLKKIGLEQYTESFVDNGYETVELCANLSNKDMTAIGITNKQHRSTLVVHARMLIENDSCPVNDASNGTVPHESRGLPSAVDSKPAKPARTSRPKLTLMKANESFSKTYSGSLECLIDAIKPGYSRAYEHPHVLLKSSSLQSLNNKVIGNDAEVARRTHKRTSSDTPTTSNGASREKQSEFSGLPPQLALHSQSEPSELSPSTSDTKVEQSPIASKIKSWLHIDHRGKSSYPLISRNKPLLHTSSVPVMLQRPRRSNAAVPKLRVARMEKSMVPMDLLATYQFLSLGCCTVTESNPELRQLLTESPHNTEGQNYKLSYQLEAE